MSTTSAESVIELVRETEAPLFVINLCASTTPVALTHPNSPELKRYTFFVTRRREEGRDRFRLHMGYFTSLEEADGLLAAIRDVYPAAWAGPAPSNKAPAAVAPKLTAVVATPAVAAPRYLDVASAAVDTPPVVPAAAVVAAVSVAAPTVAAAPVAVVAEALADKVGLSFESMSNVRQVIAELSDEPKGQAALAPPPVVATLSASASSVRIPQLKAASPRMVPELKAVAEAPKVAAPLPANVPTLSDSQVLSVLEPLNDTGIREVAATSIRMITPEDTQTLRDIKLDVASNAPASFAVQLMWSVTPIDMEQVPHLAIFDAYTLYNIEGRREGRRWYGVRLGFFTDANAAKQVAYYVRSDFSSVAVVPVTVKERQGATGETDTPQAQALPVKAPPPRPAAAPAPASSEVEGFQLLNDDRPTQPKRDVDDTAAGAGQDRQPAAARPAVAPKPKQPTGKRVVVRNKTPTRVPGATMPLEETLEMLGASTLTIDEGREFINDSAVRKPIVKAKKGAGARFVRLLSRLSDRMGDPR